MHRPWRGPSARCSRTGRSQPGWARPRGGASRSVSRWIEWFGTPNVCTSPSSHRESGRRGKATRRSRFALLRRGVDVWAYETPGTSLRVETITDSRTFMELEPAWTALLEEARVSHPFATHAWVRTWWECFGDGKELHVLVVKAGDRP